ncbi:MAG TPA: primosomal protein N' [Vitreimonas sp.]|uniref:replication restart helicase PriA n=1 Tax=Vitreimonas sp. TaxID=3069702 RepID=UPI002D581019|nr:primosomal protein N' [Vitreimonas sp.]HYD89683.1 primosomal protein N' [Vitreimonas sp.]
MTSTARRRAMDALKRKPAPAPAGPLFAVAEEGADFVHDTLDKIAVLFPLPLPEPFDYRAPSSLGLKPGMHVIAPIGPRLVRGVVWRVEPNHPGAANLKAIEEVLPGSPVPEISRAFVDWAAKYLVRPPGDLVRMVVRSPEALFPPPTHIVIAPTGEPPPKLTEARKRVMEEAAKEHVSAAELARRAETSSAVVKGLVDCGALAKLEISEDPPFPPPILDETPPPHAGEVRAERGEGESPADVGARPLSHHAMRADSSPARGGAVVRKTLSEIQQAAADTLCASVRAGGFHVALLDGVTGSGKTEVYLEAAAEALRRDPTAQVLVLLPEIALTQAAMSRFNARFGVTPVEWHSAIPHKARRRAWREIAAGRARLIVGARSALFLPYPNLKLIVIDEEHDPSYKQEEGVIYQARDLAVARAKLGECMVILASATPSLETLVNAQSGRYAHVKLPSRHGAAELPDVELVDLKIDAPEKGRWLSPKLIKGAAEALLRGEQALFYMNRRGYAPLTLCKGCGHRMRSPDSDSWLVEHRYSGRLVCHLTGFSMPKPKECPECLAPDSFTSIGPGVERIEEEVRFFFPEARIEIFSSDTTPNGDAVRDLVARMEANEIDILIGTQIVAKGHNFPNLTFVGVVDADLGLKGGDLRAGERTFQLVSQVAGRAGRHEKKGRALIQTYAPQEPVMQALLAQDRDAFFAAEIAQREAAGMPPYGRLAAIIVSAPDELLANDAAKLMGEKAPVVDGLDLWGPAPAPLSVIRGMHRRRFLIRANRGVDVSAFLAAWSSRVKLHSAVRVQIDVDPYSFL